MGTVVRMFQNMKTCNFGGVVNWFGCSVVGWGTVLQAGKSQVRFPTRYLDFSIDNPSSRTMSLGSTLPLAKMSTKNLPGGNGRMTHKADLTAICEPIV
jgi:hypothetical protein